MGLNLWVIPMDGDGTLDRADKPYLIKDARLEPKFKKHVQLQVVSTALAAAAGTGNEEARHSLLDPTLQSVTAKLRSLLDEGEVEDPKLLADLRSALGVNLIVLGERDLASDMLEEARELFKKVIDTYRDLDLKYDWAGAQINHGCALWERSRQEDDLDLVEKASKAFRRALSVFDRKKNPDEWGLAQNNLGLTLAELGKTRQDSGLVQEAIEAYQSALSARTRKKNALGWASTQNNLANALRPHGDVGDPKALDEAVRRYMAALEVFDRERLPLAWVRTTYNLGVSLGQLGSTEPSEDRLVDASKCLSAALEIYTREEYPSEWAETKLGLGLCFRSLGDVCEPEERKVEYLQKAISSCEEALTVYTREDALGNYGRLQEALGISLTKLGWIERNIEWLGKAMEAFDLALEAFGSDAARAEKLQEYQTNAGMFREMCIMMPGR